MSDEKIVIINNGLSGGGIEKASSSLANYLSSIGYKVSVIALYKREKFFSLEDNVEFYEPEIRKNNKYLYVIKMINYVRRLLKKIKPDAILSYGEWTNSYVVLANLGLKNRIYLSDRMSPDLNMGKIQNFFKQLTYPLANGVIAQTNYAKEVIYKKTKHKNIAVIPNPLNPLERIPCIIKNQIVSVGRLTKEKGHQVLIQAFAKLNYTNWHLCIVGDGPERPKLEQLSEKLGIKNKVLFVGHQLDVTNYLSESKIFVLPSLSEGFPNALIEAMSLPLACISSDCIAGPRDIIIDNVNGILVKPNAVSELTDKINKLISDEVFSAKLAQEAFKIRRNLNFESIARKYINFILK